MQPKPVSLSRRLYSRAKAWYLRRLDKSLKNQLSVVEKKLMKAADEAQFNAQHNRRDPALQERRQFLRADQKVIRDRLLINSRELRELGAAA